jgi:hypothetical protein
MELSLEALVFAVASVAVYEGSRRLLSEGVGRMGLLLLVLGLVPPVFEGLSSLRLAGTVRVLSREMSSMNVGEPAGGWEKAPIPPEERTARSRRGAQIDYLLTGKPGTFVDAAGQRVPFVPGVQDLRDREGLVVGRKAAEDTGARFDERGTRLLAGACALMLCGAVVGFAQRRRARRGTARLSAAGR